MTVENGTAGEPFSADPKEALEQLKQECLKEQLELKSRYGRSVSPLLFIQVEIDTLVDFLFPQFFANAEEAKVAFELELYAKMLEHAKHAVSEAFKQKFTEGLRGPSAN